MASCLSAPQKRYQHRRALENKQKTPVLFAMSDDRCWICLGFDGDLPPMADPHESRELVTACGCSLKVHKKCLLDWTASIAMKNRQEGVFVLKRNPSPTFVVRDAMGSHHVTVRPTGGLRVYFNEDVKCPQCQTPFMLTCKPSMLLNLSNLVKVGAKKFGYYALVSTVSSVFIGSVVVSGFSVCTSLGFRLFQRLAPMSVLMKLLGISERNLDNALLNNKVTLKHLSLMCGFPAFLLSLRGTNTVSSILRNVYPLCFFNTLWKFDRNDPRNVLLFAEPLHELYTVIFNLSLNRFHYRMIRDINTCFLANNLPLGEIDEIENENEEFEVLEQQRIAANKEADYHWVKRFLIFLFPNYSPRARQIITKRRQREFRLTSKIDYSTILGMKSKLLTLLTTFFWPFAGEVIGKLLVRSSVIRHISNKLSTTPDESTYLINILGCCLVVFGKDLFNLFITWKYCNQYKNISVLDTKFEGFETEKSPVTQEEDQHHNEGVGEPAAPVPLNFPGAWVGEPGVAQIADQIVNDPLNADADNQNAQPPIAINYGDLLNQVIRALTPRN